MVRTCPHFAARQNEAVPLLEVLFLKLGCDLSKKNKNGWSPLHCAFKQERRNASNCVKFLLDAGS